MKSFVWMSGLWLLLGILACKPLKIKNDKRDPGSVVSADSDRPQADIDPEAPFMLIPKSEEQLAEKLQKIPDVSPLQLNDSAIAKGSGNAQDFYLAINRRELSRKWFLTASTKQLYPLWYSSPFVNLGTRVVTFATQNAKLFVFDVDERRAGSSVSAPTVVIDAYPIVPLTPKLKALGIDDRFIVFDPAEGIASYSPVRDLFSRLSAATVDLKTDLQYLRRYKRISDGIYYEMVFTGMSNVDLTEADPDRNQDPNPARVVGTLGVTLRRYEETSGFVTRDSSELQKPFYFTGADGVFGPNATQAAAKGVVTNPILKWGKLQSGMSPVVFRISPQIRVTQEEFPEYDIIGAVTRGIESWNDVFGFRVFKVIVGSEQDSWASDDTNMIIWDDRGELGYAYADARINPSTGEIRGANIYADASWVYFADEFFNFLDPAANAKVHKSVIQRIRKQKPMTGFRWGDLEPLNLCQRPEFSKALSAKLRIAKIRKTEWKNRMPAFQRKMAVESYLSNLFAHETGHILGLRHNFKGSTFAPTETSSVMDYFDDFYSAVKPFPAVYDKDAIRFLYGKTQSQPAQAFCTDEDLTADPFCRVFDFGIDPLQSQILPNYRDLVDSYLVAPDPDLFADTARFMQEALDFVQAGPSPQQKIAWEALMDKLRAKPIAPGGVPPKKEADELTKELVIRTLLMADPAANFAGTFIAKPKFETAAANLIAQDLAALALNVDTIRSMEARRLAIDALKRMQADAGLQAMTKLKSDLLARKASLPADQAVLEGDLIARVDKYLSPYFQ